MLPISVAALVCLLLPMAAVASMDMDPAERETLFRVMEAISSDRDWRSESPDPCGAPWPGLECKPAAGSPAARMHVTRLDFGVEPNPTCKDAAAFPSEAFTLPHLQSLFFVDCFTNPAATTTLTLPAPANLSASGLQQLSIRANPALSGTVPPELAVLRSLQVLTISQNGKVRGGIPRGIGELTSLVRLDLSYNSLSGAIPSEIGELKSLVGLDLSYNSLSGAVPSRLGELRELQKLDLSSNNLTGTIPDSVANLTSLTFLALSNNALTGRFPPGIATGLRNLQYLIMDNNPMDVPLPSELGDLTHLQELRLAGSGYSGPIPAAFGRLGSLTTLSLQDNNLTGPIPAALSRLGRMYHLNLSNNALGGAIPFDGAFMRRLGRNLDLSGNSGLCLDDRSVLRGFGVGVGSCRGDGTIADETSAAAARGFEVTRRGSSSMDSFLLCVLALSVVYAMNEHAPY